MAAQEACQYLLCNTDFFHRQGVECRVEGGLWIIRFWLLGFDYFLIFQMLRTKNIALLPQVGVISESKKERYVFE